nr:ubiquitin fusion degradation protein [Cryptomonas curvata]
MKTVFKKIANIFRIFNSKFGKFNNNNLFKLILLIFILFNMVPFFFNDENNETNFHLSFSLKCYPINFIKKFKDFKGDKILLPASILKNISNKNVKWPLIFEISNKQSGKKTHCGVLEFTSDEGCAYLPYWVIKNLISFEGQSLFFKYADLEKGNYVKIQPQSVDFLNISNPRAVLEANLRFFTCLTKEDVLAIDYNEKIYWLNVLEVKPGNAISIIETDINVDFITPINKSNNEKIKFTGEKKNLASQRKQFIDSDELSN